MNTSMPKPRMTDGSRGFILYILFALLFLVTLSGQASAANCTASYTNTSNGGSTNYTLASGQSLKIASGTYTGTVEFGSGSTICVETGATFAPAGLNNVAGTLTNYGTANLQTFSYNAGTVIDNYGTLSFTGGLNTNGATTFRNRTNATMNMANSFQLGNNSSFTNDGSVIASQDFNTQSGTTLTNNYRLEMNGNFNPDGIFNNYGRAYAKKFINMNANSTITNYCTFVSYDGYNNNSPRTANLGTILIMTAAGTPGGPWQNNQAFYNGPNAKIAGGNFINNSNFTGSGALIFSGSTTNQGAFNGDSASSKINFYDETQTGTQFFDFQNVTPTNTVRTAFARPTELDSPVACSGSYKSFANPSSKDYGDAPASYGVAEHTIVAGIHLGNNVPDAEAASQHSHNAWGDGDDEDGAPARPVSSYIPLFPVLKMTDTSYSVGIKASNTLGSAAKLYAWIDFDQNGSFDADEATSATVANGSNAATITLTWNSIPVDIKLGTTFIRLRLTSDSTVTTSTPTGSASNGEVEDFALAVAQHIPPDSADVTIVEGDTSSCSPTVFTDDFDKDSDGSNLAEWLYFGENIPAENRKVIRNWTATGGGMDTYARTIAVSGYNLGTSIYFGNGAVRRISPAIGSGFTFDANGKLTSTIDAIELRDNPDDTTPGVGSYESDWGPYPVRFSRTFNTTAGQRYRLYFDAVPEQANAYNGWQSGIMRVDTPSGSIHFKAPGDTEGVQRYRIEFTATGASSTISFVNYGHVESDNEGWCSPISQFGAWCTVGGGPDGQNANELIIDNVVVAEAANCGEAATGSCPTGMMPQSHSGNAASIVLNTGVSDETQALEAPAAIGATASSSNSAQVASGDSLGVDLGKIVPGGEHLEISLARDNSYGRIRIETSLDDSSYTPVGTFGNNGTWGPGTIDKLERLQITVPGNGARYVRFIREAGSSWVDAVSYGSICSTVANGAIAGTVYTDSNTNNAYDPGTDFGLGSITVSLYDEHFTPGNTADDTLVHATSTAADGSYSFTGLNDTLTYRIAVDTADTNLPAGASIGTSNPLTGVVVNANSTTANQNFGFDIVGVSPGIISGTVYTDSNTNNMLDATEAKLPNITVNLYNSAKTTILQSTSTGATGAYSFSNVTAGTYQLEVNTADTDLPAGALIGTTNPLSSVAVTAGATTANQNFGFDIATSCPIVSTQSGNALEIYHTTGIINTPASALGSLSATDTTANTTNSAKIPNTSGAQITLDLGYLIPANTDIVVSLAQDTTTSKVDIQFSSDNVIFTSMGSFGSGGTLGGSTTDKLTQKTITVPAGGVQYVKFLRQASSFWIDGIAYSQICFDGVCDASQGEFGGIAFRDYNQNGIWESREQGVGDITVTAYDSSNTVKATATTDANGWYTLAGLTSGSQYRLEFTGLPSDLNAGAHGTGATTNVRFITMGADCGVNFAISDPAEYCQANPYLAVPSYTYGNSAIAAVGSNPGVYTFPYNATGNSSNQTPSPTVKSTIGQTGATWGTAYQASTKTLYTSAVMRRFVGFGTLSTGGIYKLDMSNPAAASTGATAYIDVRTLGIPTGNDVRDATACNSLATATDIPSHDVAAWDAVGKVGIGDIDYDETNRTLWLVNLNDKKLYGIRNISPTTPPVAADVLGGYAINLPAPYTCTNGVFRPWAVKYYRGKVYVGGVCDASSNPATANLKGYILKFDPANTGAGFSYVKDIPFDYNHPIDKNHPVGAWAGWISAAEAVAAGAPTSSAQHSPIISNLEFDTDESIIVGVIDRASLQNGDNAQNVPSCTDTTTDNPDMTGDILRLCKTDTGYIGDSEPGCKTNIPADIKMQDEYYWGDYGIYPDLAGNLREIALGGLALVPGTGEVVSTTYDDSAWLTNEVMWLNNKTGAANDRYYLSGNAMGKAAGMGELEVLCDPAPIEIGNRVWLDSDSDGIQDAGEMGIPDVSTTLTCGTDSFTATTDAQGEYYFSNKAGGNATFMGAGESCTLRVVNSQASLNAYSLTTQNADSKTDNDSKTDIRDSDGVNNAGTAEISFTVGSTGQNNHGLDFGYQTSVSTATVAGKVFEDVNYGGGAGRAFGTAGTAVVDGTKVELYSSAGAFITSTTTAADGSYSFGSLAAGNYYVRVVNATVKSTRTGTNSTERGIQTYRTDGTTANSNEVGGRKPSSVDATTNTTSQTLDPVTFLLSDGGQAQSVQPVTVAAANISGVDFGFNFSTVVNTNDSGQGSLRQAITNANLLANTGMAQPGSTYGFDTTLSKEVLVFNIPANSDPLGRADICGGATCTITLNTKLPNVTAPLIIDGTTQLNYVAGSPGIPRIQIRPAAGLTATGLEIHQQANDSTVRGLSLTGFGVNITNTALSIWPSRVVVESNYIGVTPGGTVSGNGVGIELSSGGGAPSTKIRIGGATADKRNIISGFSYLGISMGYSKSEITVQNNFIGTNPAGTASMTTGQGEGVHVGTSSGVNILDNVISGMAQYAAISINDDGAPYGYDAPLLPIIIQGNRIGVGVNDEAIGNAKEGILNVGTPDPVQIGGIAAGQANIIAYNSLGGVLYTNLSNQSVNTISHNSIYANGRLGIDLGRNLVTLNDANDADTGANNLLNFPILSDISTTGGNITLKGCAPAGATVELFEADVSAGGAATPGVNKQGKTQDYGEGQTYLTSFVEGSASDTDSTDCAMPPDADLNNQTGMKAFSVTIPKPASVVEGDSLTTTATRAADGTSEFSPIYTYSTACSLVVTSTADSNNVSNNSGSLRDAIECANSTPATDTITFNIPTSQPGYTNPDGIAGNGDEYWSIQPSTPLPGITQPLTIDGSTQPGTTCPQPRVEIDGSSAGADADGIGLYTSNSTIKGLIINDFSRYGIRLSRFPITFPVGNTLQTNNTLQCSYIGVNASGLVAKPNLQGGIAAEGDSMKIGGTTTANRNIISGNGEFGIYFYGGGSTNGTVQGNYIGVGANGTTALGNQGFGVGYYNTDGGGLIGGTAGVTVNGACTGTCNLIAHNTSAGIGFFYTGPAGRNVRISGNAIHSNGGIGIDLERGNTWVLDGVNPNDVGDSDSAFAPNALQNYPVLTSAALNTTTTDITGTLNSIANATFTLEFFANTSSDPSGYGEGERYLGNTTITTNGSGNASFTVPLPLVAQGTYITATATDANNNTSEFSSAIMATAVKDISGKVFEDVNYGGGAGRDFLAAGSGAANVGGAQVELYNSSNTLLASTTTAADGSYTFTSIPVGTYSVKVASDTVSSTRAGSNGSELGVMTYRTDGVTPVTTDIGGQATQPITLAATNLNNVSFGFNFDTVSNTNDSGAGSLRQFIINANLLGGDNTLNQSPYTAGKENAVLALTTSDPNYSSGYWSIALQSALPAITSPLVLDGSLPPGSSSNPVLELKGTTAGAGTNGLTLNASANGSTIRKLAINGFGGAGIYLNGSNNNTLQGNHIGVTPSGAARANTGAGILLNAASSNLIGGTASGEGNLIANNGGDGIAITGATSLTNTILGNSIHTNTGLGIDLGNDGVTANDAGDTDSGPNDLLNFPEVQNNSFGTNGTKVITYDFDLDVPAGDYRLEFFASTAKDPSNHGEGQTFIGSKDITHPGTGSLNFKGTFNATLTVVKGTPIAATLTRKTTATTFGATSEFSGIRDGITAQVCDSLVGETGADMVIDESDPDTIIKLLEAWDYTTSPPTPIAYVISGGEDGSLFTVTNPTAGATLPCATIKFISSDVVITKSASAEAETRAIVPPGYLPPPGNYELPLDKDKDNVYDLQVTGTTASGKKYVRDLSVRVMDTNEAPLITSAAAVSFSEDSSANVLDIASQDPDAGTVEGKGLTYQISGGADASHFEVAAATGILRFRAVPDHDAPMDTNRDNLYEVEVSVTDTGGLKASKLFKVSVMNNTADDGVLLNVRVLLQGAYDSKTALMSDDLNVLGLLPGKQPYKATPFSHAGTETLSTMLQETTGNNAPIDWILVELRSIPSSVVASRAVMLQRDGDLVDSQTGSANLHFAKVKTGNYYVSVRHRNHLGIISASPVSLDNTARLLNFASSSTAVKGEETRLIAGKLAMMWAGDINSSNTLTANGPGNDVTSLMSGVITSMDNLQGNTNHILSGYLATDLNMDGKTLFTGPGNDTSLLVGNIILHPLNTGLAANYIVKGGLQ